MAPTPADKRLIQVNAELMISQRKLKGFNQTTLGEMAQVAKNTIGKMEKGEPVSVSIVQLVAPVLDLTYEQLVTLDDAKTKEKSGQQIAMSRDTDGRLNVHLVVDRQDVTPSQRPSFCQKLATAISAFLALSDGFDEESLDPRSGSVIFTMKLTTRDAKSLMIAFIEGRLGQFGVISVDLSVAQIRPLRKSKAPTLRQITAALKDHESWLSGKGGERFDGSNTYLAEANLHEANLTAALFYCAQLSQADLGGCKLDLAEMNYAELEGASLRDAQMTKCLLDHARIDSADLHGANLTDAKATESIFRHSSLKEANLTRIKLDIADLYSASGQYANFQEAWLQGADLRFSNFTGANFTEAHMAYAMLYQANLSKAKLKSAVLKHADLRNADLSDADLTSADLTDALLEGVNLSGANTTNVIWGNNNQHFAPSPAQ
jgi:uncharacterized protein YjbI with pentapeptide repeats/transcriptional regulator with XRE-family HTH domain